MTDGEYNAKKKALTIRFKESYRVGGGKGHVGKEKGEGLPSSQHYPKGKRITRTLVHSWKGKKR